MRIIANQSLKSYDKNKNCAMSVFGHLFVKYQVFVIFFCGVTVWTVPQFPPLTYNLADLHMHYPEVRRSFHSVQRPSRTGRISDASWQNR